MAVKKEFERTFGDYQIIERLGIGGMATVYRALHTVDKQEVALKIIHEHYAGDDIAVKRLEHEARIAQQLKHPNIVPITGYGTVDERPYLVMPYFPNGTLAEFFSTPRAVTHTTSIKILNALAPALDYAHSNGVVHRDFKLENILLSKNNVPHITDFGIARANNTTRLTATGQFLGTPLYIAPEQVSTSDEPINYRADLYAFAVMSYLMLTGYFPFTGDDAIKLFMQHKTNTAPLPSRINEKLPTTVDNILLKGLAKRPDERYSSAQVMVDALEAALQSLSPTTTVISIHDLNPALRAQLAQNDGNQTIVLESDTIDEPMPPADTQAATKIGFIPRKQRYGLLIFLIFVMSACGVSSFVLLNTANSAGGIEATNQAEMTSTAIQTQNNLAEPFGNFQATYFLELTATPTATVSPTAIATSDPSDIRDDFTNFIATAEAATAERVEDVVATIETVNDAIETAVPPPVSDPPVDNDPPNDDGGTTTGTGSTGNGTGDGTTGNGTGGSSNGTSNGNSNGGGTSGNGNGNSNGGGSSTGNGNGNSNGGSTSGNGNGNNGSGNGNANGGSNGNGNGNNGGGNGNGNSNGNGNGRGN